MAAFKPYVGSGFRWHRLNQDPDSEVMQVDLGRRGSVCVLRNRKSGFMVQFPNTRVEPVDERKSSDRLSPTEFDVKIVPVRKK